MYAALSGEGPAGRSGDPLHREMPGVGNHEVVVESPRHDGRIDEMDREQVGRIVRTWRERYRRLIELPNVRAVIVFKNFGPLAGTSLVHTHSQIVATPVLLPRLFRRMTVATRYHDENGACVYDDVIEAEREAGVRLVEDHGGFIAFEPWASNSPYETWVAPTFHQGSFGDLADDAVDDLAGILIRTLSAIRHACGDPDFNLVMYSAPSGAAERVFHWHLKIVPKLSTPAGFEMGSAMSITTLPPEEAAAHLRGALR